MSIYIFLLFVVALAFLPFIAAVLNAIHQARERRLRNTLTTMRIAESLAKREASILVAEAKIAEAHNKVELQELKIEVERLKILRERKEQGLDVPEFNPRDYPS